MVGSCNRRPRYEIIPQKVTNVAIIGNSGHPKALTSGSGGTTGTGGYRTGRVQPQDGGVLPDRLALEEAGPAHELRHGVVDHRRGYARGRKLVRSSGPLPCGFFCRRTQCWRIIPDDMGILRRRSWSYRGGAMLHLRRDARGSFP